MTFHSFRGFEEAAFDRQLIEDWHEESKPIQSPSSRNVYFSHSLGGAADRYRYRCLNGCNLDLILYSNVTLRIIFNLQCHPLCQRFNHNINSDLLPLTHSTRTCLSSPK